MIINFIPSTKEFWGWKIVQPSVYCIVLIMSLVWGNFIKYRYFGEMAITGDL